MKHGANTAQLKTWIEIDAKAIQHNFRLVQKHVGNHTIVIAVVKSNAYGHGLCEVAKSLCAYSSFSEEGWFGVDSIDEALTLKKSGVKNPILILGYTPKLRLTEIVRHGFRTVLYDLNTAKDLARAAKRLRKKALVHLKIETGTFRQGIFQKDILSFAHYFTKQSNHIKLEGIYTHFADAECIESSFYKQQLAAFRRAVETLYELGFNPPYVHTAASAAILVHPDTHQTMVRLGISLYGLYPSRDIQQMASNTLQPALTWKTRIAQIKQVPKGGTVGYNRTFTALKPITLAILPVGYWDGYDRHLSNKGSVLVKGKKVSVIGNICMNILMIDITGIGNISVGDEVVLLGRQGATAISAEEFADKVGTINYEVTTRINPLIPRIVV